MEIQKEIKELREKLESLEKQISSKHEFAKGWNYFEFCEDVLLLLNPYMDGNIVKYEALTDLLGRYEDKNNSNNNCTYGSLHGVKHRPATPSEIKDALVKVCEKMGIVPGAKVKRPDNFLKAVGMGYESSILGFHDPHYHADDDSLVWSSVTVYYQGQFATVVKEEEIKIGGYKCEWTKDKDILKVGCKEFPYWWVTDLRETMQHFKINHVLIEHEEIELETIVKILKLRDK